jgi:hypothetical protein
MTGLKREALDALPEIVELAKDTLPFEKLEEANLTAEQLIESKEQKMRAISKLKVLTPLLPIRPLNYLRDDLHYLPRKPRYIIRHVGDYLDLLTKEMTFEFVGGKSRTRSLGRNVENLKKVKHKIIPLGLIDKLQRFNNFIYTTGKHDFSLPPGRQHTFTSREAVLVIYVAIELGEQIKSISKLAREAVEKDWLYAIGGRWRSPTRVYFKGELEDQEKKFLRDRER